MVSVVLILSGSLVQIAKAADTPMSSSWVNVEVPYFGANSIEVQITVVTPGNNLEQGMGISKIFSSSSSPSSGGISSTLIVTITRPIIEAVYSADTNMTTFTYTFSNTEPVHIAPFGNFPNDGWNIGITFYSNFKTAFNSGTQYCSIPSPYYIGKYTTTYSQNDTNGSMYYNLNLEISHPSTFPTYVNWIFYPFLIPLTLLAILCSIIPVILFLKKRTFEKLSGTYITVSSAVVVFIPIFYLSTQELKTPFTFTCFDTWLVVLLAWYIVLLAFAVVNKVFHIFSRDKTLTGNIAMVV
jgi:hypothetical protein